MEFEFDKEIDALLRQAAQGETAPADSGFQTANSPHLDADEISAFAENALPGKMRTLYTAHLADCARCRKILSNVVASNLEIETVAPKNDEIKIAAPAAVPFYRRLFAAPSLAYAMGALVLIFAGLFAFTFLRDAPRNAEVSQISEKPVGMRGASSDGATVTTERENAPTSSMSNAASAMSNMTMTGSTQSNASARGGTISNGANFTADSNISGKDAVKNKSQNQPPPKSGEPDENQAGEASLAEQRKQTADKEDARVRENNYKANDESASDVAAAKPAAPKTAAPPPAQTPVMSMRSAAGLPGGETEKKARRSEAETRAVGGKNFRRADGVWYDSDYKGQGTTNVARGSGEYKKLDSGLRSIAENLSGTIVVVWKSKAYRIQ